MARHEDSVGVFQSRGFLSTLHKGHILKLVKYQLNFLLMGNKLVKFDDSLFFKKVNPLQYMHTFVKPLTYVTAHCYYFTLNMFSCDNLVEVFDHA